MIKKIAALAIILLFLFSNSTQLIGAIADPFRIGMGSRPLAMGKSFIGIADDANVIFLNPAGLPSLYTDHYVSMLSKLDDDTDYVLLGGTWMSPVGRIGLGVLSLGIGEIYTTRRDGSGRVALDSVLEYGNEVLMLSWGKQLNQNTSIGFTGKFYNEKLSGAAGGSARGLGLDLGLLHDLAPRLKVGLLHRNILATPMTWGTGREGELAKVLKLGIGYFPSQQATLGLDLDFQQNRPALFHLGGEWKPFKSLALRGGFDQVAISQNQTVINYGLGVGLRVGDFSFDYTYTMDPDLQYNNSHFFSISLGIPKGEAKERERQEKERVLREKFERERLEKERLARLEKERKEKERKEREELEKERRERERIAREKRELEKRRRDFEEQLRKEKLARERKERGRIAKEIKRKELELAAERRREFFGNIGQALGTAGENIGKGIGATGRTIGTVIGTTGQNIGRAVGATGQGIGTALGATGRTLGTAGTNIGNAFNIAGKNLGGAMENMGTTLGKMIQRRAVPIKEKEREIRKDVERVVKKREIKKEVVAPVKVKNIREVIDVVTKVMRGEITPEEFGKIIPQIATNLLVLALKIGLFLMVLIVVLLLFREWEQKNRE